MVGYLLSKSAYKVDFLWDKWLLYKHFLEFAISICHQSINGIVLYCLSPSRFARSRSAERTAPGMKAALSLLLLAFSTASASLRHHGRNQRRLGVNWAAHPYRSSGKISHFGLLFIQYNMDLVLPTCPHLAFSSTSTEVVIII